MTCDSIAYSWSSSGSAADGTLFTGFIAGLNGGDYYSPAAGMDVSAGAGTCFANHCDWRIPTFAELQTIFKSVSGCGSGSPCIDPAFGPTQASLYSYYWSSSSPNNDAFGAWTVLFYASGAGDITKMNGNYARAVRSGR